MRVHLAYVLNPDVVDDLRSQYIGAVGEAYIDDVTDQESGPQRQEVAAEDPTETRDPMPSSDAVAIPSETTPPLVYEKVDADIEWWVSKLAAIAAAAPEVIPDLISHPGSGPGIRFERRLGDLLRAVRNVTAHHGQPA